MIARIPSRTRAGVAGDPASAVRARAAASARPAKARPVLLYNCLTVIY